VPRRNRRRSATWKIVGRLERANARFGFVVPEGGGGDVYVPARRLSGALDGDEVEVEVRRSLRSGLLEGSITRVVHRPQRQITGTLTKTKSGFAFVPDNPRFPGSLLVSRGRGDALSEGDRVVVCPEAKHPGDVNRCRVTEVLGDADDARLDSLIVARELGIPTKFGELAEDEAAAASPDDASRPELRDHTIFTIDPAEAHDFDDAVSVRQLSRDTLEVGVHIADVSSFMTDGGPLDIEAMQRGNSVYLPDAVFPMLPERLSSELCSLSPGSPKLCVSLLMEISTDGRPLRTRFVETRVTSERRFTYEEVQDVLDGKASAPEAVARDLKTLSALARALNEQRMMRNAVDLELPELKVRLTEMGLPRQLCLEQKLASHSLIEELMILANSEIGRHITRARVPFIFRVHPGPKKEKVEEFLRAARVLGARDLKHGRGDFRRLRPSVDGPLAPAKKRLLDYLYVRAMEKARYDVTDIGHYGLAIEGYCHFTSPIRRYADLVNHRVVKHCLVRRAKKLSPGLEARLAVAAELCTQTEIRADQAEREAVKVKALRYMQPLLGEVFEGMVVGVVNSGLFVEVSGHWVEGMVSRDSLRDDSYHLGEDGFSLVGKRRGRRYALGQDVRVQVARVDPLARLMDLVLVR
jgi:ribonuclease R